MSQTNTNALQALLQQFSTGEPAARTGVNEFLSSGKKTAAFEDPANTLPGFGDIFKNFRNNVNSELDRGTASLRESFGVRGGRLSSDLLRATSNLRQEGAQRIIAGAAGLRGARESELASRNSRALELGNLALSSAGSTDVTNARALATFIADFLRRTSPPPLLQGLGQFGLNLGSQGQGTTIVS